MKTLRISLSLAVMFTLLLVSQSFADAQDNAHHRFEVVNLVSNRNNQAMFKDKRLKNPIGLVINQKGFLLVANNKSSKATLYTPLGMPVENFKIKGLDLVTGVVRNNTDEFIIPGNNDHRKARLIFCTEDGKILVYNKSVNSKNAIPVIDRSFFRCVYKGITIAPGIGQNYIYATDFFNGKVDIFDSHFDYVGSFTDPNIPENYTPFNVRRIGQVLYVTFAKVDKSRTQLISGEGHGFVSIFNPSGILVKTLLTHQSLNSPWGMAIAPVNFGRFGGALLVGNYGDGRIHAYNPWTGDLIGCLRNINGDIISIPNLWSLNFPNTIQEDNLSEESLDSDSEDFLSTMNQKTLYFTSGPNDGRDGFLGIIFPVND